MRREAAAEGSDHADSRAGHPSLGNRERCFVGSRQPRRALVGLLGAAGRPREGLEGFAVGESALLGHGKGARIGGRARLAPG